MNHATLAEVSGYTMAAEKKKFAAEAIVRLSVATTEPGFPNLPDEFGKSGEKADQHQQPK
jgi:hypothetical protein